VLQTVAKNDQSVPLLSAIVAANYSLSAQLTLDRPGNFAAFLLHGSAKMFCVSDSVNNFSWTTFSRGNSPRLSDLWR